MPRHVPVLLAEAVSIVAPTPGEAILDVTVGLGGHSHALLTAVGDKGSLVALDADSENLRLAEEHLKDFHNEKTFVHANFSELPGCLPQDHRSFDIILADLGLSSPHVDDPLRGFTFHGTAPLDMRFDQSRGHTAAMLMASLDPQSLTRIFCEYGELPAVHRLVRAIVEARSAGSIRTSADLSSIVKSVYGYKAPKVLPQVFQALRIAVNDELGAVARLLSVAPSLLKPGGRLAIIAYHSLEDRLVKTAFRTLSTDQTDPVTGAVVKPAEYELLSRRAVRPSDLEIERNPRARSAVLRAIARPTVYDPSRPPAC